MSKRQDFDLLNDIKEAIGRINRYLKNIGYKDFLEDIKTQDAVVRNLEIIGEAAKNISGDIRGKYPKLPWKEMAGARDRLIHHYFGVNFDIVWTISKEELPTLVAKIDKLLKTYNQK